MEIMPKQCPICGKYLNYVLDYKYGNSYSKWTCSCGYDSSQEAIYYWSDTTASQNKQLNKDNNNEKKF